MQKQCPDCGIVKRLVDFPPAKKRSDGRGTYCRLCMRVRSKESYRGRQAVRGKEVRDRPEDADHRRCPDCDLVKPLSDFPKSKNASKGHGSYCKPCHNVRGKETKARLHGSERHYHLMRRYGISAAEVDAMIEAQGGLCAICQEAPPAHVDHDHESGAVRGILCFNCNGGLGQFRDRVDIMAKAITYLERQ